MAAVDLGSLRIPPVPAASAAAAGRESFDAAAAAPAAPAAPGAAPAVSPAPAPAQSLVLVSCSTDGSLATWVARPSLDADTTTDSAGLQLVHRSALAAAAGPVSVAGDDRGASTAPDLDGGGTVGGGVCDPVIPVGCAIFGCAPSPNGLAICSLRLVGQNKNDPRCVGKMAGIALRLGRHRAPPCKLSLFFSFSFFSLA